MFSSKSKSCAGGRTEPVATRHLRYPGAVTSRLQPPDSRAQTPIYLQFLESQRQISSRLVSRAAADEGD